MFYEKDHGRLVLGRNIWRNPAALSLLLGGGSFNLQFFHENQASLLYQAVPVLSDKWAVESFFEIRNTIHQPPRQSKKAVLAWDMTAPQKDFLLQTIESDHLRAQIYHFPDIKKNAISRIRDGLFHQHFGVDYHLNHLMPPYMITTKPAFYPAYKLPKEMRHHLIPEQKIKDHFEVNALLHNPDKISEGTWGAIYPLVASDFYPMQFVAVCQKGLRRDDGKILLQHSVNNYFKNDIQRLKEGRFSLPQDVWHILALQPHKRNSLSCTTDMRLARNVLQELEQEFIDPHYRHDTRLQEVDDSLQEITGGDPSHYSLFSDAYIDAMERIEKIAPLSMG